MKLLRVQVPLPIFIKYPKGINHVEVVAEGQINLLNLEVFLKQDHFLKSAQEVCFLSPWQYAFRCVHALAPMLTKDCLAWLLLLLLLLSFDLLLDRRQLTVNHGMVLFFLALL